MDTRLCLLDRGGIHMPLFFLCCFFQLLLPAHHIEDVRRQRDLAGDDIAVEKQHEQLKALIGRQRFAEQVMMPLMEDEQPFLRVRKLCIRPCAALQRDDLIFIAMQDEHRTEDRGDAVAARLDDLGECRIEGCHHCPDRRKRRSSGCPSSGSRRPCPDPDR